MEKISLLNWDIPDNNNTFKVEASNWELNPVITDINLLEKKITVSIDLYSSKDAYLAGATKLKSRVHRIDLSSVEGLQQLLLAEVKKGVERLTEQRIINPDEIDPGLFEFETIPGFFAPKV